MNNKHDDKHDDKQSDARMIKEMYIMIYYNLTCAYRAAYETCRKLSRDERCYQEKWAATVLSGKVASGELRGHRFDNDERIRAFIILSALNGAAPCDPLAPWGLSRRQKRKLFFCKLASFLGPVQRFIPVAIAAVCGIAA